MKKTMMGKKTPPAVASKGLTAFLMGFNEPPGSSDSVRPFAA